MRRILLMILLSGAAAACDKVPGTEAYKQRTSIEGAEAAVAYKLVDPSSAQFRNVTINNDFACGEVNGKNRMGAYAGFLRFTASLEKKRWAAELDPQFDQKKYKQVQRDCDIAGSTHNAVLAQLSCRQVLEMGVEQVPQFAFDLNWDTRCKPK